MLKEILLHMLFIGAVVLAGYFLKNNTGTTRNPETMLQASGIVMDDDQYPYTADASPVTDTLKQK